MSSSASPQRKSSRAAVSSRRKAASYIRRGSSGIHGHGLYARCAIEADTEILEYIGERISKAEGFRREALRQARARRGGDGCVTIFHLNSRHDLDGRVRGNVGRYINHSCEPNCRAVLYRGHIWITTRRAIAADEEITIDYGFPLSDWAQHPCRCGTPKCAGYIVDAGQRWRLRKRVRDAARLARRVAA